MCSWLGVEAQSVRLTPYDSPSALYANLDHLYNYNRYEKSRIELGFTWVNPSETARQSPSSPLRWRLNGYAAYGFGDKALKYGGGAKLRLPGRGGVELELKAYNDYTRAASRSMEGYRMLAPDHNPGFLSSRFVGTKGGMLGFSMNVASRWTLMASIKLNWEDYRFDGSGAQLYPRLEPDLAQPTLLHTAFTARAAWDGGLTLSATAGRMAQVDDPGTDRAYLRALAQYSAYPGDMGLHLFAQAGFCTDGTPYSQMFDLSGTARSVYFFRNTFLTVAPYRFAANMFAHLCLNYTAPLPLWQTSWSQPHPFLQISAMWGWLHGQDEVGQVLLHDIGLAADDCMLMQAPYQGLAEMATGFDGLLRWGLIDLGAGVAYQLCPTGAPYLNEKPTDNFTLVVVATFVLDKTPALRTTAVQTASANVFTSNNQL